MRLIKKSCVLFLSVVVLGWMANILAFILPQGIIHSNISKSVDALRQESAFFPVIGERYRNSIADNNTDAWMLLMADYDGEENILKKSVGGYHYVYENNTITGIWGYDNFITSYNDNAKISYTYSYARYWHGWLLPLRLLLLFFSYEDIRYLSMVAISFLLFYFIYMLLKKNRKGYAVVAATSFLMMTPITAMISFEYAFIMYITLISNIIMARYLDKWKQLDLFILFFLGMGMLVSYIDFLTYPIVTLGFCLITYFVLIDPRMDKADKGIIRIVAASISWGIGYIGMWVTKWLIGTWVLKRDIIAEGISQFFIRTSATMGHGEATDPSITYLQVLKTCIGVFSKKGYVVVGVLVLVFVFFHSRRLEKNTLEIKQCVWALVPYFLVFCMPFVWAFVCKNHTYTHVNFTSNIFSLSYLAVAGGLLMLESRKNRK